MPRYNRLSVTLIPGFPIPPQVQVWFRPIARTSVTAMLGLKAQGKKSEK